MKLLRVLCLGLVLVAPTMVRAATAKPTILKHTLLIDVWQPDTISSGTGWRPLIKFQFQGPVPSGSEWHVEFFHPNKTKWMTYVFEAKQVQAGDVGALPRPFDTHPTETTVKETGLFPFEIKIVSALSNLNETVYKGTFRVEKNPPITKGDDDYYIVADWVMPEAQIYAKSQLGVVVWMRYSQNQSTQDVIVGHLFRDGAKIGEEVGGGEGRSINDQGESHHPKIRYKQRYFEFPLTQIHVPGDKVDEDEAASGPKEYELKILRNNKLSRSIKFKTGAQYMLGKSGLVEPDANLGNVMMIPVTILGSDDGDYNKNAGAERFWGNP